MNLSDGIAVTRPLNDLAPLQRVPSAVVAEWPAGTFVENLVARPDGTLLVAVHSTMELELIEPGASPASRRVLARLPGPIAGPAQIGDALFVNVSAPGRAPGQIFRVGASGQVEAWVTLEDALFLNGATPFIGGSLLVADSILGRISRVDTASRSSAIWLDHPALKKVSAEPWLPGVNGLKVFGRHVYFSNTDAAHIGRVAIGEDGEPGAVEIVATHLTCDDFAFDATGNLYATTHVHNSLLRLSPDGQRVVLADAADGMAGSTAVAFGRSQTGEMTSTLYVTTTGGILAPHEGRVRTAKLIRLDVGVVGHSLTALQA